MRHLLPLSCGWMACHNSGLDRNCIHIFGTVLKWWLCGKLGFECLGVSFSWTMQLSLVFFVSHSFRLIQLNKWEDWNLMVPQPIWPAGGKSLMRWCELCRRYTFCCSLFSLVSNFVPWASMTKEKISTTQEFFYVKCAALSFLQSEIIGISYPCYAIYWHVANVWFSGEETTNLSHQGLVNLSGSLLPWLSSIIMCRW
jgi:hypothetical protein